MRQTALAAFALALALSMQASAETPPFTPDDSGVTKVLKLVQWIGALDDMSAATDTLPNALGLRSDPIVRYWDHDGKKTKVNTEYLTHAPIWPGARSTIQYTVSEDGFASLPLRARTYILIELNPAEACIHMADMVSSLGKATEDHPVTDDEQGLYDDWVLRQTPWKTIVQGYFGLSNNGGCLKSLSVNELR
jgi:hypothetical protein